MKQLLVCLLITQIAVPSSLSTEPHISSVYKAEMGDKVQITCPLDCTEGKEAYNWSKFSNLSSLNESSLVSSIEKVLKFEVQGVEDGGYYRCFSYCKRNTTAWIKLNVLPIMTISEPVGVKTGETIELHCRASGSPRPSIVWSPMNLNHHQIVIDDYTTSSHLTIEDAQKNMSGSAYACSACYPDGGGTCKVADGKSTTVYASVLVYDPVQLIAVKEVHTVLGEAVTLECRAIIDPRLTYSVVWRHNGELIDTKGNLNYHVNEAPPDHSLKISSVDKEHLGSYQCVVASLYAQEEASEKIELLLYEYKDGSIMFQLVTSVVVAIFAVIVSSACVYFCWQKKQAGKLSQWEKRAAEANNQEPRAAAPPSTSKRLKTQTQKMDFEVFAKKHGLDLRGPT